MSHQMGQADSSRDAALHSAAWISEATRRLARLDDGAADEPGRGAGYLTDLEQLRDAVARRIAALPRMVKPIRTAKPGIMISQLVVGKVLARALAEPAAAMSASVADIVVDVASFQLTAIHIELLAVGVERRDRTYLEEGDTLRACAAAAVSRMLGIAAPPIRLSWNDILVTGPRREDG